MSGKNGLVNAKYIAYMGILLALSLTLTALEGIFTPILPVGIRIGLANIAVMTALMTLGWKSSLVIVVLKSAFVLLTRGLIASIMSISGGLLALIVIILLYKLTKSSILLISICGAISHNLGQILVACIITSSIKTIYYTPVLLIAGVLAGICTGLVLKIILPAIRHILEGVKL